MSNWKHFTRRKNELNELIDIINLAHPRKDEMVGMLSKGTDFHIWIKDHGRTDNEDDPEWDIRHTKPFKNGGKGEFEKLLETEKIIPIGFNDPEGSPSIWYFYNKAGESV